jgi:PhnB protein
MGSDTTAAFAASFVQGTNFSISFNTRDTDEATRIFNQLSEGGKITMPMSKTFWGALFGMFTDKFGIPWMVNCELEPQKA